jgi:Hypoxia induced protein conserved region
MRRRLTRVGGTVVISLPGGMMPAMTVFLTVILVLAMLGVLVALGVGVATMLKGGNPRRSNKMMQMRVIMQAVALVVLALLMMMAANR